MPFVCTEFVRVRPFVYHLTSTDNLANIRREFRLHPATELLRRAGVPNLSRTHRPTSLRIDIDGRSVHLRDQAPLKPGNLTLSADWLFGDVVALLNARVFFWPGWDHGPIAPGVRHFRRYRLDPIAILRVDTRALLDANPDLVPEFCKWNSGAPRWSQGRRPKRDRTTFLPAARAPYRAAEVVELTFPQSVRIPAATVVGPTPAGPWSSL
jgi:hypothetical protein